MNCAVRILIATSLAALVSFAPIAHAESNDEASALNQFTETVAAECPEMALGILAIDGDLAGLVADRAAYATKVCQCVVDGLLKDERTFRLLTVAGTVQPELLNAERNKLYLVAKVLTSTMRCTALALDDLLGDYSMDYGTASAETQPAKP
jgi:hypothetical protein